MAYTEGICRDWNDTVTDDGKNNYILPEGDYFFTIMDAEKSRFPGSKKIPACNQMNLTLGIKNSSGTLVKVRTNLILYSTMDWKTSAMLRSVGLKKHGETVKPPWDDLVGLEGWAHISPKEYQKDGETKKYNNLDHFIDKDKAPKSSSQSSTTQAKEEFPDHVPFPEDSEEDDQDELPF